MGLFSSIVDAISPVTGLISGALGAYAGYSGQQQANASNQASVQAQMDFQAQQSSTQYQRAVKDMSAAGLNPMLASQVGGNASMGGASTTFGNVGSSAVSSAANAANLELIHSQAQAAKSQAAVNSAQALKVVQDTKTSAANEANLRADSTLKSAQYNSTMQMADKLFMDMRVSEATVQLVSQQIKNAALTGTQITANTGNIEADTVLKKLQQAEYGARSKFYTDMGSSAYAAEFGADVLGKLGGAVGHVAPRIPFK